MLQLCPVAHVPQIPVPQEFGPHWRPLQLQGLWHTPVAEQVSLDGHAPHAPLHVGLQAARAHCVGQAAHWLWASQVWPVGQVPQVPPHPLSPHCLVFPSMVVQLGVQAEHCPAEVQVEPTGHWPQLPPHPLSPQFLPPQFGWQAPHFPVASHACPAGQEPQVPPHPSSPHTFRVSPLPQVVWQGRQVPSPSSHLVPAPHEPQVPPQPSGPHDLPPQFVWHFCTHFLVLASQAVFPVQQSLPHGAAHVAASPVPASAAVPASSGDAFLEQP
jgi:hypothetical protein